MRLYLPSLNVTQFELDSIHCQTINKALFLGDLGRYEIINDRIFLFKYCTREHQILPKFFDEMPLILDYSVWQKHKEINHLPFAHVLIELKISKYKITNRLFLCIESRRGSSQIVDWYFSLHDDKIEHAKNELHSFIKKTKNAQSITV